MNSRSWRGTVLFTVILVVMGATVGLKLYGLGDEVTTASSSVHSTASGTGSTTTGSGTGSSGTSSSGSAASSTPTPTASSSSSATKTITGSAVDTRYGAVQVEVTFSGTTITALKTLQAPDRDGRDVEINSQALPILEQEVLASQSANIDTVSGATYTSEGYIQSVQSAIDQR
ncbi:FMN-binding protein [Leifsonia sp. 21MFCrub1.1]|uniref:FMN-binding protein n=1 Tax=Leifsonia sp. 21MFCrub1.1 TaxID=1798223 RepID=UPI0008928E41|nr:FMN-binding protein [Leifsonia sp. 21MFCrub1.1]SEB13614.1 FMN-binding domain-containing protein [Leifsonia sp. 21MFCrub1.1]